jgi:hypothetical protein
MVRGNLFEIFLLKKISSLPKKYLPGHLPPKMPTGAGRGMV